MTQEEKEKLFKQNPNNFVFRKDIIAGIVRTEKGPAMVLNIEKRAELTQGLGELQVVILRETIKADSIASMTKAIVPPQGGIMGFVRRRPHG